VTAAGEHARPGQAGSSGLLEKLVAAVRPEFRADVLVPDPGDPVLGWAECLFPGCGRPAAARGLCAAHHHRWRLRGRPELAVWLASPERPIAAAQEPAKCIVPGCGRCRATAGGLCQGHASRWRRAGCPDLATWAQVGPPLARRGRADCALPGCTRWAEPRSSPFCLVHTKRWVTAGRPEVARFIEDCELRGRAHIDLRGLAPQLKLEMQYAIQRRHDDRSITLPYQVAQWAIDRVAAAGPGSLLDCTDQEWQALTARPGSKPTAGGFPRRGAAFLAFARDQADILRDGAGWETEYGRDVWRLARLPGLTLAPDQAAIRDSCLRFDRITQPWLKELAKRWLRLRLSSGLALNTVYLDTQAVTVFSTFLATAAPEADALACVDRPLLERYLAWLATQPGGGKRLREKRLGPLQALFRDIRRYGWDDTLPTTAMFFTEDFPKNDRYLPRALAEHVMAQIERPDNLARWDSPERRLMTLIMIRGGLRLASVTTISFDCLRYDGQGAPYLLYRNTKMKREAAVPIDEEIEAAVKAQQARVQRRWPTGSPYLFPRPHGNADGRRPISGSSYRAVLNQWLASCDIRDEHGQPVHLTPHQWRHTFATRLINKDVPQEIIRVLLDHASFEMTARYARISDATVRRRWEQATKVNIKGERVTLDPTGPLAQAQWAKTRYGMATQTLPNGYCGLPIQKSCPHANACLTCPVFITGPEFLPELREQHRRTLTLVEVSTGNGQARVAEMNQQVLVNLGRMISELEAAAGSGATDAS
jgi:integrase